jgi:hypothetical protein
VVILMTDVFALQTYSRPHLFPCMGIRIESMPDGRLVRLSTKTELHNPTVVHCPPQPLKGDSDSLALTLMGIKRTSAVLQRRLKAASVLLAILKNSGQNIGISHICLERPLSWPNVFVLFMHRASHEGISA